MTLTGNMDNVEDVRRPKRAPRPFKILCSNLSKDLPVRRTTSAMWGEEYDPFQVFEVEHDSCLDLEIVVLKGENITKGSYYKDFIDTPDPYVILRIPRSSNSSKRTSHLDNTVTPLWNETFHFYLDPRNTGLNLVVTLMDANYTRDENLGEECMAIADLKEDEEKEHVLNFTGGSKVFLKMKLQKNKTPDLRFSLSLCEQEKEFLRLRREKVGLKMNELLGEKGPRTKEQVPIVAVLGSGGGFRAMICFSGAVRALHKSGILGCSTFISGLSGSSWLISTLYAHDKFPDVTYDEIYKELRESVTTGWKWQLLHSLAYIKDMVSKCRKGQPVSFTDFFGHLLGDVLLKDKKSKRLSDQQAIVAKGTVPFPLYTCLHAKESVSCKAFSEWVEFSPFEIGIAKYGTFMKTEHFGNKFIIGKLIKLFPEFPLHYLQGVWGSAFTILAKRLLMDGGSNKDMVQIMREERDINELLEKESLESSNTAGEEAEIDTDDDYDMEGNAYIKTSSSSDEEFTIDKLNQSLEVVPNIELNDQRDSTSVAGEIVGHNPGNETKETKEKQEDIFNVTYKSQVSKKDPKFTFMKAFSLGDSKKEDQLVKEKTAEINSNDGAKKPKNLRQTSEIGKTYFSFPTTKEESHRRISTQSDPGISLSHQTTNMQDRKKRLTRQRAMKTQDSTCSEPLPNSWNDRRKAHQTQRVKRNSVIQSLIEKTNILNSRAGRAGEVLNPFRGLSLRNSFPLSPFAEPPQDDESMGETELGLSSRYESLDHTAKKLFIVDSGLAFNSPFPLLLRPQRAVDIYLSFDFSQRPKDGDMPFSELLLAETWARQNRAPFPPIKKLADEFSKDKEVKEVYIFKDDNDPRCPVILHFPLVNNNFKLFTKPGVPRQTKEELDFADFPIFDDNLNSFASTNFVYDPIQYDRLVQLVEFNTNFCIDTIKDVFVEVIQKKHKMHNKVLETTVSKVQQVLRAANKFKKYKGLQLKVDQQEGQRIVSALMEGVYHRTRSISGASSEAEYVDANEYLFDQCVEEENEEMSTPMEDLKNLSLR